MSDIQQRLKEMAKLTVLANRMNEIQEKNLKAYPFIFFNDVKEVKIDFNLSKVDDNGLMNHDDHHISYHLELNEESNKDHSEKRFKAIEQAVRALFWNDLKVRVFFNGKPVFESKNEQRTSKKA